MKKIILALLFFSTITICAFPQSKFSVKTGKKIDDQNFMKYGDKRIISYDDNTIFFTVNNSIGKLTDGYHVAEKYKAGSFNYGGGIILQLTSTDEELIQLSFGESQLKRITFFKNNLTKVAENEILKDYTSLCDEKCTYSYKTAMSENKEYTTVTLLIKNDDKISSILVLLFDREFNLLKENNIDYEFGGRPVRIHNVAVNNDGKAITCFSTKENSIEELEVCITDERSDAEFVSISLYDHQLIDYTGNFDKNGNIILAGYFNNAVFSTLINTKTNFVNDIHTLDFPDNYDNPKNKYSIKADRLVVLNENTFYLVGFEYYITNHYYAEVGMTVCVQHSRSMFITNINNLTEPQKTDVLFMASSSPGIDYRYLQNPISLNFFIAKDKDNLYILYFDNKSNMKAHELKKLRPLDLNKPIQKDGVCMLATFDANGNFSKELIYDNSKEKIGLMLVESMTFDTDHKRFKGFMAGTRLYPYLFKKLNVKTLDIALPE